MERETQDTPTRTRREWLAYGGTLVGGGLFAGCLGDDGVGTTDSTPTPGETPTDVTPALAEQLGDAYESGEHTVHFQVASATHRATTLTASKTVATE
jgi:hypothetical protein